MSSTLLVSLLLLAVASSAAAFDVGRILASKANYGTFTNLLLKTKLADDVNRQKAVTVLVVADGSMGPLSALPPDAQRRALALHVVLGYYDPIKLDEMKNNTGLLLTLLRAAEPATTDRTAGLLNYNKRADGQVFLGPAAAGDTAGSKLIKVIAARPYTVSIMQVSAPILPPGLDGSTAHFKKRSEKTSSAELPTAGAAPRGARSGNGVQHKAGPRTAPEKANAAEQPTAGTASRGGRRGDGAQLKIPAAAASHGARRGDAKQFDGARAGTVRPPSS